MDTKFCNNLKEIRKSNNLTQKEVAIQLNVVESCYVNWERGRTEPNISMLRKLAVVLNTSIEKLING